MTGLLLAVTTAPRGAVLQSNTSTSSVRLQDGHALWVSAVQIGKPSFLIHCIITVNLLYSVLTLSSLLPAGAVLMYLTPRKCSPAPTPFFFFCGWEKEERKQGNKVNFDIRTGFKS